MRTCPRWRSVLFPFTRRITILKIFSIGQNDRFGGLDRSTAGAAVVHASVSRRLSHRDPPTTPTASGNSVFGAKYRRPICFQEDCIQSSFIPLYDSAMILTRSRRNIINSSVAQRSGSPRNSRMRKIAYRPFRSYVRCVAARMTRVRSFRWRVMCSVCVIIFLASSRRLS